MRFAAGPFNVDYEARPDPAALRRKRLQRAQRQLAPSQPDALLVSKDENVRHLTALRPQLIGHGVGIGANEPPPIGETLPGAGVYEYEPGTVFPVEPHIWVEGVRGGVRLEEMVLITEAEAHVLSRAAFDDRLLR